MFIQAPYSNILRRQLSTLSSKGNPDSNNLRQPLSPAPGPGCTIWKPSHHPLFLRHGSPSCTSFLFLPLIYSPHSSQKNMKACSRRHVLSTQNFAVTPIPGKKNPKPFSLTSAPSPLLLAPCPTGFPHSSSDMPTSGPLHSLFAPPDSVSLGSLHALSLGSASRAMVLNV